MSLQNFLISHRLRGFDLNDCTEVGLRNALSFGIKAIEFDTRITKDKRIVINHDPHLYEQFGNKKFIHGLTLSEVKSMKFSKSNNQSILTLEECIVVCSEYKDKDFTLYLDIKQFFLLDYIYSTLIESGLLHKTVIVSWLPEVLKYFYSKDKSIELCFSFVPIKNRLQFEILKATISRKLIKTFITKTTNLFSNSKVFTYDQTIYLFNNYNNRLTSEPSIIEKDYEHYILGNLQGELLYILQNVNGMVCIPVDNINEKVYAFYRSKNIKISLFTVNTETEILNLHKQFPELFFMTDNSNLFQITG